MGPLESPWSPKVIISWWKYSSSQDMWLETICSFDLFHHFSEITSMTCMTLPTFWTLVVTRVFCGRHVKSQNFNRIASNFFGFYMFSTKYPCDRQSLRRARKKTSKSYYSNKVLTFLTKNQIVSHCVKTEGHVENQKINHIPSKIFLF